MGNAAAAGLRESLRPGGQNLDGSDAANAGVTADDGFADLGSPPPGGGGTVVFDSTGDNFDGSGWAPLQPGLEFGQSFTSGALDSTLTDVQLVLEDPVSSDGGSLTVTLWSDDGGPGPGSEIATLGTIDDSSLSSSIATIDLPISGGPALDAGTRYWVEVTGDGNSNARWEASSSLTGTEDSSEYIDTYGAVHSNADLGGAFGLQISTQPTPITLFDTTADSSGWPAAIIASKQNQQAQSFSTDGNASILTDVQFVLWDAGSPGADSTTVTATLWSDSGGPGPGTQIAVLGTISASTLSSSAGLVDLTVSSGPTLAANTRYWIELNDSGVGSDVRWEASYNPQGPEAATEFSDFRGVVSGDDSGQNILGHNFAYEMSVTVNEPACYAAGTRILTDRGEVAVEALRAGDRVVALRRGRLASVRWVGHRTVAPRRHPDPRLLNPVRIHADAFAPGEPHRDLLLSPDHAVFVDGALVVVRNLVNGATIVQETADRITYYHIELDAHDVLLAEGLPAESYLDTGNRAVFENGGGAIVAHPDFRRRAWNENACAPTLVTREARARVKEMLLARAGELGHGRTDDPDLHVIVGGEIVRPVMAAGGARFDLPACAGTVRLMSRAAVPSEMAPLSIDKRRLGVSVHKLWLDDVLVPRDDPRLTTGWHAPEAGWRWTDGAASLEAGGARTLTLKTCGTLSYWNDKPTTVAARRAAG